MRLADIALLFSQDELSGLQIANALLIALGQRAISRIECAVYQTLDITLDLYKLFLDRFDRCRAAFGLGIPEVFQHGMEQPEQVFAWPHGREQLFEVAFDLFLLDPFAEGRAGFVMAVIIDVVF